MSLDDAHIFERVVSLRSFTRAAVELGLSKATVSARIAGLESRVGLRLLHRSTRAVSPTADGEDYYLRVLRPLQELAEAERALTGGQDTPRGLLRLTCPRLLGDSLLGPVITRYLSAWPEARVQLDLTERVVDLIEEGVDLALRVGFLNDSSMVVRRLGLATMVYAASPAYLASRGLPTRPDELAVHALITVSRGEPVSWPFRVGDGMRAVAVQGRLAVNALDMARDAAIDCLGIAFLPRFLIAGALADGSLVALFSELAPPPMPISAVTPSSRHLSPRVRVFLDMLVAHVAQTAPWGG